MKTRQLQTAILIRVLYKTTFNGMEAASILLVGEIPAEDHHKVDWKKCIICQENKFTIKKISLIKRYQRWNF